MPEKHQESNADREPRIPTTVVRCISCPDPGYECKYCNGNGTVWEDQYGKTMHDAKIRSPNCFNWDSFDFQTMSWDDGDAEDAIA